MSGDRMESLDECTVRVDGRYTYLGKQINECARQVFESRSDQSREESVRRFMQLFGSIGRFYVHFGGAGDGLLLLSTFYDKSPGSNVVSVSNSATLARSLFDSFPALGRVYIVPYPDTFLVHAVLRKLFSAMPNCLGMGIAPRGPDYFREWGNEPDIVERYSVDKSPRWIGRFRGRMNVPFPKIVIHPVGGVSPLDNSVRKMIRPEEFYAILELLNADGIVPAVIGTPDEASYYRTGDLKFIDRRSLSIGDQMKVVGACEILIGADSWAKTFAALCGIDAIVFHSVRGESRNGLTEVGDNIFLRPWPTITVVNDIVEFRQAFSLKFNLTDSRPDRVVSEDGETRSEPIRYGQAHSTLT